MKKFQKLAIVAVILAIVACAALFVACNNDKKQDKNTTVTLTLYANDGTDAFTTETIAPNALDSVKKPTRTGYAFDCWAFDAQGTRKVEDGYTFTKDVKLYAQWTKNVYNVTFKVDGTQIGEAEKVPYGEAATAPSLSDFWQNIPEGKAFDGWDTDEFESVEKDLTVNANLTNADFTVRFEAHNTLVARFGGKSGSVIPTPADPEIAGYVFANWQGFEAGKTKFSANATYAAQFTFEPLGDIAVKAGGIAIEDALEAHAGDAPTLSAELTNTYDGITYGYNWTVASKSYSDATVTLDALTGGEFEASVTCTASDSFDTAEATATTTFAITVSRATVEVKAARSVIEYDWAKNSTFTNIVTAIDASVEDNDGGSFTYTLDDEAFTDATALTKGGTYLVNVHYESDNREGDLVVTVKIKAAKIGDVNYTLEDALAQGGDIVLFGDAILSGDNELKNGSKLVLPYDGSDIFGNEMAEGGVERFYIDIEKEKTYLKRTLEVKGNLSVKGALVVGGTIGIRDMNAFQGATLGDYAQIDLAEGAKLTVDEGGNVAVHGFIKGEGETIVNVGGTMLIHFVVRDFRGGSCAAGVYLRDRICPFNQYEFPSVQTWLTVYAGGTVKAHAQLYAGEIFNNAESTLISYGKADGLIQLQSGYVKAKYTSHFDSTKGNGAITGGADVAAQLAERFPCTTQLEIHGDANIGALSINVLGLIDIKTSDVLLPLSFAYDVTIASGKTVLPTQFKLLPGAKLTVAQGATLELDYAGQTAYLLTKRALIVYEAQDWQDATNAGYFVYPRGKASAQFVVNGTFNVTKGSSFGGKIASSVNGAKVSFANGSTILVESNEGWARRTGSNPILASSYESTITYTETREAELVGANGNAAKAAANTAYTYNGSAWA